MTKDVTPLMSVKGEGGDEGRHTVDECEGRRRRRKDVTPLMSVKGEGGDERTSHR